MVSRQTTLTGIKSSSACKALHAIVLQLQADPFPPSPFAVHLAVQGKQNNIESLQHKNIMKKAEDSVKPVSYETCMPSEKEITEIKQHFSH